MPGANPEKPLADVIDEIHRRCVVILGEEIDHAAEEASKGEPFKTLFALAATTGARLSECLGLVWRDLDLADAGGAAVSFAYQVDRHGRRQPLKTEESRRTVELPRSLAAMLLAVKARSPHSQEGAFAFATRSGRAVGQRNVLRELRRAMAAASAGDGKPTFPALHAVDDAGRAMAVERGTVPNFHAFRHTAASEAIAAGDGAEEVSWQLGHKNSNVTRAVYVQEVKSAERRARRREQIETRYGAVLGEVMRSDSNRVVLPGSSEVVALRGTGKN